MSKAALTLHINLLLRVGLVRNFREFLLWFENRASNVLDPLRWMRGRAQSIASRRFLDHIKGFNVLVHY